MRFVFHTNAQIGESRFYATYQYPVRSLSAFEKSEYADDWRDLMRLYLVRRTRSFIQEYYAQTDAETGRKYLLFPDGRRSYFPVRVPCTVTFAVNDEQASDAYALLYSDGVVEAINTLNLPRYGLANSILSYSKSKPTPAEKERLDRLSKAGKRLMAAYGRSSINRDATVDHRCIEWAPQVGRPGFPAIYRTACAAQLRFSPCH